MTLNDKSLQPIFHVVHTLIKLGLVGKKPDVGIQPVLKNSISPNLTKSISFSDNYKKLTIEKQIRNPMDLVNFSLLKSEF